MGISFEFPNALQTGDCIAVVGEVGKKQFILNLVSNFVAFNPDDLYGTPRNENCEEVDDLKAPISDTIPLMVTLNTTGEWDVVGETPETSSNASGYNAARNGFRTNEMFIVIISIKKEHFEIKLNGYCLSLSDHMIPVSCIQKVTIEGDCLIGKLFFGDVAAVEQSSRKAKMTNKNTKMLPAKYNLDAIVVECRVKDEEIESLEEYELFPEELSDEKASLCTTPASIRTSFLNLPSLYRSTSYQIVFDAGDSDEDIGIELPSSNGFPLNRAASCGFLASAIPNPLHKAAKELAPVVYQKPMKSSLVQPKVYSKINSPPSLASVPMRRKCNPRISSDMDSTVIQRPVSEVITRFKFPSNFPVYPRLLKDTQTSLARKVSRTNHESGFAVTTSPRPVIIHHGLLPTGSSNMERKSPLPLKQLSPKSPFSRPPLIPVNRQPQKRRSLDEKTVMDTVSVPTIPLLMHGSRMSGGFSIPFNSPTTKTKQ